jgi:hypothetical protein
MPLTCSVQQVETPRCRDHNIECCVSRSKIFVRTRAGRAPFQVSASAISVHYGQTRKVPLDLVFEALRQAAGEVVQLGIPVEPGTACWIGSLDRRPVLGLASRELFGQPGALDLLLLHVLAGETLDTVLLREIAFGSLLFGRPRVAPYHFDRILSRLSPGTATHSLSDGARRTSHDPVRPPRCRAIFEASASRRLSIRRASEAGGHMLWPGGDAKASVGCRDMAGVPGGEASNVNGGLKTAALAIRLSRGLGVRPCGGVFRDRPWVPRPPAKRYLEARCADLPALAQFPAHHSPHTGSLVDRQAHVLEASERAH